MELNYLNLKADVNHTHTEYAVVNHTHPEYEGGGSGSGGGHGDNCVSKNQYESDKIVINELIANKASIGDLRATNAEINNLKVNHAVLGSLVASKADIVELNAQMAQIENLKATKAEIKDLEAVTIKTDTLDANYAKINNLLAGNLTAGNIQAGSITSNELATGTITAGSGVIADGAIGNAQISSLDAGKISSGKIDTSKVEVVGADGHLRIKGNRLQVFQGVGNQAWERVSLGDVNGDGTAYGFRVRGSDGKTVLLDENGVKAEGITNGIITNDKISDNADIDGAKLNINSVVTRINDDSSETIKGTKINVDGTNLETKLYDMNIVDNEHFEKIKENSSKITANENSIKLKVDSQTYENDKTELNSKMNKNTSEINLLKNEISLKVEQSDIDKVVDEVIDEIDEKVNSVKSEIKVTTDSITQQVSNLTSTVSSKADKSSVTTVSNKVSSLETNLGSISGKVSNLETTTNTNINDITGLKNEVKTVKSDLATLDVSLDGIAQRVSATETKTNTLTTNVNNAQSTADSKAKIFTSTPVPPYKVGDLWVQGSTGEIMRCKTARSSGSYLSSDWEKASKYTDDTKANAVDGKVTTLQSTVNTTNSKVASIETNLSGITSRVSNVETKTTTIEGQITNHENRIKTAESKITDSAIINIVSSSIDKKVENEINNLQIGGNNLHRLGNAYLVNTSKPLSDFFDWGRGEFSILNHEEYGDVYKLTATRNTTASPPTSWVNLSTGFDMLTIEKGIDYTLTFEYLMSDNCKGTNVSLFEDGSVLINEIFINNNSDEKNTFHKANAIWNSTNSCDITVTFYNRGKVSDDGEESYIYLRNIKFEKGNKATDWTPSPFDQTDYVDSSLSTSEKVLNENIDNAISDAQNSILQNVADNYATASEVKSLSETVSSSMTQTNKDIEMKFTTAQNYTKEVDGKLQDFQNTVGANIRFSADGIDLGKTSSPFTATLSNEKLAFKQNGDEIAYISNNKMYITNADVQEVLRIGTPTNGYFSWIQGTSGNLSLKWSES